MDRCIDICVVVVDTKSPRTIPLKSGEVTQKQRISVVDDSAKLVSLEIWNTAVKSLDDSIGQCIIVKGVKVKRYKETIYLELSKTGVIQVGPGESEEIINLREWWRLNGDGET